MGLSPKPTAKRPLKTWKDLDNLLQINMMISKKGAEPSATIDVNEYEMSAEEIIAEGERNNYSVNRAPGRDNILVFK